MIYQNQYMINRVISRQSKIITHAFYNFAKVKFPLPDLGQKIKQGTVKKLYVAEGDKVVQFQKIADVQSDKQFTQITAPQVGVISKLYYKQAEVCKVGDLFLQIETESSATSHVQAQKKILHSQLQSRKNENMKITNQFQTPSSTVVRMYAKHSNIDLNNVKGSGKKGRILKQDIINFIENNKEMKQIKASKPNLKQMQKKATNIYQSKVIRMNPFQKGMQKSMTQANKIPHLYYDEKVDITQLDKMRQVIKKAGFKVTIMGILTKTFSLALSQHPHLNSIYRPDKDMYSFEISQNHNISLAIDTPNGLVVPNIKNVETLSILQIQEKLSELKKLADQSKLTKNHLQGGSICLSNIGTIAGISACPLILSPQVCIVAIGKVVESPFFNGHQYVKRKYMTMSFGCDHRIVDGASVAKFSNEWKKLLQNPYLALAKMH